jgi:hypothetical protein
MDFNALQHKLFAMDPQDPADDIRKMTAMAANPQESVQPQQNIVQESANVQEGTMPVEGDYSLSDFAALAGVKLNEGPVDAWKAGFNNYNKTDGIKKAMKAMGDGPADKSKAKDKKQSASSNVSSSLWKSFLKEHTAGLQKIASNPRKKAEFDKFMAKMAESVQEAPKPKNKNTRHRKDLDDLERTIRQSKDGMDKDTQAHINKKRKELTLNNSVKVESIKSRLWDALNSK